MIERITSTSLALLAIVLILVAAPGAWAQADTKPIPVPLPGAPDPSKAPAPTEATAPKSVAPTQRWSEDSFGVSLQPPTGARLQQVGAGDAILRIFKDDYVINVYLKRSEQDLNELATSRSTKDVPVTALDVIAADAIDQIGRVVLHTSQLLETRIISADDRPRAVVYFQMTSRSSAPWILGEGFVQIDPFTYVMLTLEINEPRFPKVKPEFEAVIKGVQLADPAQLDQQRVSRIEAGKVWLETLTTKRLHAALIPVQTFRVVENNADVGWAQIRQGAVPTPTFLRGGAAEREQSDDRSAPTGPAGLQVEVRTRIVGPESVLDTWANYFLADDTTQEFWSIRSTQRGKAPAKGQAAPPVLANRVETGLRERDRITVSRRNPSGNEDLDWKTPMGVYLSRVPLIMAGTLLPRDKAGDKIVSFYAYHPESSRITLHTIRVAGTNGGFVAHVKPSPEMPEQLMHYDSAGRLQRVDLPSGQMLIAATAEELKRVWGTR